MGRRLPGSGRRNDGDTKPGFSAARPPPQPDQAKEGRTKLTITGSPEGIARLVALYESGELTEICGQKIAEGPGDRWGFLLGGLDWRHGE